MSDEEIEPDDIPLDDEPATEVVYQPERPLDPDECPMELEIAIDPYFVRDDDIETEDSLLCEWDG